MFKEDSKEYKYYAYKLQEFRRAKQEEKANEGDTEENPDKGGATKGVKRKRKSRWGPQEETQPVTAPGLAMPGMVANIQLGGATAFQPQGEWLEGRAEEGRGRESAGYSPRSKA